MSDQWPEKYQTGDISDQICQAREVVGVRTGAKKFIACFQSYNNAYGSISALKRYYDEAFSGRGVIGLTVGIRPDCAPESALELLAGY